MEARDRAQLDREWMQAEDYLEHFKRLADAAEIGTSEVIKLLKDDFAFTTLILKACAIVCCQCFVNKEDRDAIVNCVDTSEN